MGASSGRTITEFSRHRAVQFGYGAEPTSAPVLCAAFETRNVDFRSKSKTWPSISATPDPFNQRAVLEGIGFIHILTKEIWEGHPCCAFAAPLSFATELPNTYGALLKSIIDATQYASNPDNRVEIAEAISPTNYLNQPVTVVQQVLTGTYADGLGEVKRVPDRIDFDPFPWHSMGVWTLTQMKRWGYIEGDVDYAGVAEQVYLAADAKKVMTDLGYDAPDITYKSHTILGKTFDPETPEAYVDSFEIKR